MAGLLHPGRSTPVVPHGSPPAGDAAIPRRWKRLDQLLAAMLLVGGAFLYLDHLSVVLHTAVDIPFSDDWDLFRPDGFASGFSLRWLLAFNNEHRIATTKLLQWISFRTAGYNLVHQVAVNFALWTLLILLIAGIVARICPGLPRSALVGFSLFLLSPVNWESHSWALAGAQSHLSMILLFTGGYLLFHPRQSRGTSGGAVVALLLGTYSSAAGLVGSVTLLALFAPWKAQRLRVGADAGGDGRPQMVLTSGAVLIGVAAWLWGYQTPAHHPPPALPTTALFWSGLVELVGYGLGGHGAVMGMVGLVFMLAPVAEHLWTTRGRMSPRHAQLLALVLATLAILASISMGRAPMGVTSFTSRFTEYVLVLIPLTAAVWWLHLEQSGRRGAYLLATWCLLAVAFGQSWHYADYARAMLTRQQGVACVRSYYQGTGSGDCRMLYPRPIPDRLDRARQLGVSFQRGM